MQYFVWSGSLRGVEVYADGPDEAVEAAVRASVPCVLGPAIRISILPKRLHDADTYYAPPYEEEFPDLFDGTLDVDVVPVEEL